MGVGVGRDELPLMAGSPPFAAENLVTLENWQRPPFNRWAFQHVRELIPTARIPRGDGPAWEMPRAEKDLNDVRFATWSGELTVGEMLDRTYTDGFLVIHQGLIIAERYFNGLRPDTPHLLMSVSKSVTGLVAGALAGKGALDVTAPVESILPELADTSFEGATVQHLLDMRTGTRFEEDYNDPEAEIAVSDRVYLWRPDDGRARPADAIAYFSTLTNDGPHGGSFRYRSILTDVLAWVLEQAGQPGSATSWRGNSGSPWAPSATLRSPLTVTAALWQTVGSARRCATLAGSDCSRYAAAARSKGRSSRRPGSTTPSRARSMARRPSQLVTERPTTRPAPITVTAGGSRPRASHVQRGRNPRPVHLRPRPEPDRGSEIVELATGAEHPDAPRHGRGHLRDRGGAAEVVLGTLLAIDRAREVLGFEPRHSWRDHVSADARRRGALQHRAAWERMRDGAAWPSREQ